MNRKTTETAPVVSALDAEVESGLFDAEVQEDRPFITLKFIPGTTPIQRFQERCLSFVKWLDPEQLETLGAICILQRGEISTPQELREAATMIETLVKEG